MNAFFDLGLQQLNELDLSADKKQGLRDFADYLMSREK
jgi:hypothetical protein